MIRLPAKKMPDLGDMMMLSIIIHLLLFFLLVRLSALQWRRAVSPPVYYVDLVNLPVAHPRAGMPAATGNNRPVPVAPPPVKEAMKLPAKAGKTAKMKVPPPKSPPPRQGAESDREFQERLARLQQQTEERHEASALETLRQKVAAAGKGASQGGSTAAAESEAGSDYASYIQSRLKDAFVSTIAFQSKAPEIMVRISIAQTGRLAGYRIERSNGDPLFEAAVARAIAKAEKSFPPPPDGKAFEQSYLFRPQGVAKK
jgi:colicin import membrane protein